MEDSRKVSDELDLALNPQIPGRHDFLANHDIQRESEPPSGVHDLSEVIKIRPTENLDLSLAPETATSTPIEPEIITENKNQESFKLPETLITLINNLESGKKDLMLHELDRPSLEEVARQLNKYYRLGGFLTWPEYFTALKMLDDSDREKNKHDNIISNEKVTIVPISNVIGFRKINKEFFTEDSFDTGKVKENSEILPDLFDKIKEMVQDETDPKIQRKLRFIEHDLGNDATYAISSRDDVKNTLKTYLDIKFLSEEQYKKLLGILGGETSTIISNTKNMLDKSVLPETATENSMADPLVAPQVISQGVIAPETLNQVDAELAEMREDYAKAQIEYRKKKKEHNKINIVLQKLGLVKSNDTPGSPKEQELQETKEKMDEALVQYIKVKDARKVDLWDSLVIEAEKNNNTNAGAFSEDINREILAEYKTKIIEVAEKEWQILQNEIDRLHPGFIEKTIQTIDKNGRVEKISQSEILQKAVAVWTRQDRIGTAVRYGVKTVIPSLLIGGAVAFSGGMAAGFAAGGASLYRRTGGFVGAAGAGTWRDRKDSVVNAKEKEKYNFAYTDENLAVSSEEKEKQYMEAREQEINRKYVQKFKKASSMIAAGAGAGILAGLVGPSIEHALSSTPHTSADSLAIKPKSFDGVRPKASVLSPEETKTAIPTPESAKIALSEIPNVPKITTIAVIDLSKDGFLDDIHHLKAEILGQYNNDIAKIPPEIRANFVDKPTVEIAKQYGLYDPEHNTSAMGYAGDKLGVDGGGHLVYEHGGKMDVMYDAKTGRIKPFTGKTFIPEPESITKPAATKPLGMEMQKPIEITSEPGIIKPQILSEPEIKIPVENIAPATTETVVAASPTHIPYNNTFVDVVADGNGKVIKLGEHVIAHEHVFGKGKILMLDDKFQDGSQYRDVREAFAMAFEKNTLADQIGEKPIAVPFEGGKIYVVLGTENNPTEAEILLNGKEIAKGLINTKNPAAGLKLHFDKGLGGGWFLADNAYERAFKYVNKYLAIK